MSFLVPRFVKKLPRHATEMNEYYLSKPLPRDFQRPEEIAELLTAVRGSGTLSDPAARTLGFRPDRVEWRRAWVGAGRRQGSRNRMPADRSPGVAAAFSRRLGGQPARSSSTSHWHWQAGPSNEDLHSHPCSGQHEPLEPRGHAPGDSLAACFNLRASALMRRCSRPITSPF